MFRKRSSDRLARDYASYFPVHNMLRKRWSENHLLRVLRLYYLHTENRFRKRRLGLSCSISGLLSAQNNFQKETVGESPSTTACSGHVQKERELLSGYFTHLSMSVHFHSPDDDICLGKDDQDRLLRLWHVSASSFWPSLCLLRICFILT